MLGEARALEDDEPGAVAEWRRGYEETGSPVFLQRIEDFFLEAEEPIRAIEALRSIIAASSNPVLPRFFLGRLYYRLEMPEEAEKMLLGIADQVSESATYHYLLGRIRQRRGEMSLAATSYLEAVRRMGIADSVYRCRSCSTPSSDWRDRCDHCGAWNSVEMGFEQEKLEAEALGVVTVPVWEALEDSKDEL